MATLFKTTGEEKEVEPKNRKAFSAEELQAFVKGYFEILALPQGQKLICNEDARRLEMPYNKKASELVEVQILGDVLLCDGSLLD